MHGGATPRGFSHPRTIHGRYSRDINARTLARLTAAVDDPERLSLAAEIALIDTRTGATLAGMEETGTKAEWRAVLKLLEQRRRLVDSENARLFQLSKGLTVDQVAAQFGLLIEAVRRHTDATTFRRIQEEFASLGKCPA